MTALVSFERVFEVLDLAAARRRGARRAPGARRARCAVEVDDVRSPTPRPTRSRWPRSRAPPAGDRRGSGPVLRDVSFTVEPGSLVALVGPSGAGKTTITALVARLYDPSAGAVRINGVDLRDADAESLHDAVGVVTQDAHLFHDTIRANLALRRARRPPRTTWSRRCGPPRSGRSSTRCPPASTRSSATGATASPGARSSGSPSPGCCSRARGSSSSTRPPPTSTASPSRRCQRALDHALRDRSALVIAHRLSTVRHADLILVVDGGRIVERGTHAELVGGRRPVRRALPHPVLRRARRGPRRGHGLTRAYPRGPHGCPGRCGAGSEYACRGAARAHSLPSGVQTGPRRRSPSTGRSAMATTTTYDRRLVSRRPRRPRGPPVARLGPPSPWSSGCRPARLFGLARQRGRDAPSRTGWTPAHAVGVSGQEPTRSRARAAAGNTQTSRSTTSVAMTPAAGVTRPASTRHVAQHRGELEADEDEDEVGDAGSRRTPTPPGRAATRPR